MELSVVEKSKNLLKVEVVGEDHALCNALRHELWDDSSVKIAGYYIDHPLLTSPVLVVETAKKDPKKALEDAVKRLRAKGNELNKLIKL